MGVARSRGGGRGLFVRKLVQRWTERRPGGTSGDASTTGGSAGAISGGNGGTGRDRGSRRGRRLSGNGWHAPHRIRRRVPKRRRPKSYVGCEFWPTVLANPVWSIFDFAVGVANSGTQVADITVTRGTKTWTAQVQPNGLGVIYLDWVPELKGPDADVCASGTPPHESVRVDDGAYKLVSTLPVTVWQFNALEYQATGGPAARIGRTAQEPSRAASSSAFRWGASRSPRTPRCSCR